MMYKLMITQITKVGRFVGDAVLCEEFSSLDEALEAFIINRLSDNCHCSIRAYDKKQLNIISFGAYSIDTGRLVFFA